MKLTVSLNLMPRFKNRQCTYNVTLRRVRVTTVAVKKAIIISHAGYVFIALIIQHAMCMAILLSVPCRLYRIFYIIS